jgi:Kef-type K+ transport system membrane component KefB
MPSFDGLLIVLAVAFVVPFALGLVPRVRVPSIVLEIVAGLVVGPAVLGFVEVDDSIEVVALIGLAFLLFLSGLEIDFDHLRGRPLQLTAAGFLISFAIAIVVSLAAVAALLQSTSLPFIVAATAIGLELGLLDGAQGAALVGAGLLSVLLFPALGLSLLRNERGGEPSTTLVAEVPAR